MFDDGTRIEKFAELATNVTTGKEKITTVRFVKTLPISTIKKDSKSQKPTVDDNEENEEKVAMLIDAKTDVLQQRADCIISNPRGTKTLKIKVLLDPGSQKTYLSDAVKDYLKLDAITKQNVAIKTFGSTNGQLKELGEFKFALRRFHGNCLRLYMSGFSVPVACVPVSGQKVDFIKNSCLFLKLADSGQNKGKIDLLIGADSVVDGAVKRRDDVGPVALGSK